MSLGQVSNAFDLLGLAEPASTPVRLPSGGGPKLEVFWGEFRHSLASSAWAILSGPSAQKKISSLEVFKDCTIERRIPQRAVLAAALWHLMFLIFPFPQFPAVARKNPPLETFQLTWSGPINDLPLLEIPGAKTKPSPRAQPEKPIPHEGDTAFHPRQHIFSDPVRPTHPRQTLINSAAPIEPPKLLPNLPNIVQLQQAASPPRPHLQISEATLAKLRPREKRVATVTATPLPDVPLFIQKPAEISIAYSATSPARPRLLLNTVATPRVAPRSQTADASPVPQLNLSPSAAASGNAAMLIALSAAPAPPAPSVQPPPGNLAARVSISSEGKQPGTTSVSPKASVNENGGANGAPSSSGGTGGGASSAKNPIGVSISGGNPAPKSGVSGLGPDSLKNNSSSKNSSLLLAATGARARPDTKTEDVQRNGPPDFATLPPGAKPEQIFSTKKVYTLYVNMPNLSSASGSWILNFSELRINPDSPRAGATDIAGPAPLKKIDPKYPPTLITERVEGEVVLYAVIRSDGSVDSIQLVHGLDEQLDANAMDALSRWKFRPASRQGAPVDLEAIVHIPFTAPNRR